MMVPAVMRKTVISLFRRAAPLLSWILYQIRFAFPSTVRRRLTSAKEYSEERLLYSIPTRNARKDSAKARTSENR